MNPQEYIRSGLRDSLIRSGFDGVPENALDLERPKQEAHGDCATTLAMALAKEHKTAPRKIAELLAAAFPRDPFYVEKIEIAGPGFINFHFARPCLRQGVEDIIAQNRAFGRFDMGGGRRVQLEFVSANPTGPLNIVSARAAAIGDVLASCYQWAGYSAHREFYVNDAGRQIRLLGASLSARYMTELNHDEPIPEDGYHGTYLLDLAQEIIAKDGANYLPMLAEERYDLFSQMALEYMLTRQRASLDKYRLHYDLWFRESKLRNQEAHLGVLQKLQQAGLCYEQDGALWFKSSDFGDEKDRVLITGAGEPTYFLIDIAYHEDKYARGFETVIDFWGPDHHGYIDRMRAAMIALGHPEESFQVHIIQQVNLLRGGQAVKMSKRAGEIIEMDELIDEVGVDAARFFFVDRRISQPLDFDIDLAKTQSEENPVLYVQYAHARICSILRFAEEQGLQVPERADLEPLGNEIEMQVIKKLIEFPDTIRRAVRFTEPHRIPDYLQELATVFHRFYHENRVVSEDVPRSSARLTLIKAIRQVLANGLDILKISAPESM